MKSLKQIEAMITLLEEVRDEITLYNKFKENGNLNSNTSYLLNLLLT